MINHEVELLVIGAGLAGLRAAWKGVKNDCKTAIVYTGNGASPGVLAFNSPQKSEDNKDNTTVFSDDMMRGGRYINNQNLVDSLSSASVGLVESLKEIGYEPDKDAGGKYLLRHLGGSSYPRSVFSKDSTGQDITTALWKALRGKGVIEIPDVKILMPVIGKNGLLGAIGIDLKTCGLVSIQAKSTVLAGGGIGSLYKGSTYPDDVSGWSGIFALLSGGTLVDMEFVQFEPTVCFTHEMIDGMEIPTAMMGDGAYLLNKNGRRFMLDYGFSREAGIEKAFMAQCIFREIKEGRGSENGGVYFDARHIDGEILEKYTLRVERLKKAGINLRRDMVEVRPAAHSHMGGVVINERCCTGVPNLFAAGEAAGGVHGASRIAGNSGTEVLIFGDKAGSSAVEKIKIMNEREDRKYYAEAFAAAERRMKNTAVIETDNSESIKDDIRTLLAEHCGIQRDGKRLDSALKQLYHLKTKVSPVRSNRSEEILAGMENFKDLTIAETILMSSLLRQESRGAHVREDYPEEREHFKKNILHKLSAGNKLTHHILRTDDYSSILCD